MSEPARTFSEHVAALAATLPHIDCRSRRRLAIREALALPSSQIVPQAAARALPWRCECGWAGLRGTMGVSIISGRVCPSCGGTNVKRAS